MAGPRNLRKTERAVSAYMDLLRATDSITALQGQQLASFGLTVSQFRLLKTLLLCGPMSLTDAGQRMLCTESNACVVARNLEKRGLVVRREHINDRRCVAVELTEQGEELASRVYPQYTKVVRAQMSALSFAQQGRLRELCQKLEKGDPARFVWEMSRPDAGGDGEE
jgi:MarR family transcriptional regulator, 2-MHQ and catechol-resistance regulon repressor